MELIWKKKLEAEKITKRLLDNPKVGEELHNALRRLIAPYVPMNTGTLRDSVETTPEHLRYWQDYARRMYYGTNFDFRKDPNPLATAKWDQIAMQTQKDRLAREIEGYIRRMARSGQI